MQQTMNGNIIIIPILHIQNVMTKEVNLSKII